MFKICSKCGSLKEIKFFPKSPKHRDGHKGVCKQCCYEQRKMRGRSETPEQNRKYGLKTKYGLTPEDYNRLLKEQDGKCAICGKPPEESRNNKLFVDHDHRNNVVRGLLCSTCNAGLGQFMDSPALLLEAIRYLDKYNETGF